MQGGEVARPGPSRASRTTERLSCPRTDHPNGSDAALAALSYFPSTAPRHHQAMLGHETWASSLASTLWHQATRGALQLHDRTRARLSTVVGLRA
jgi:hypothetical protein